MAALALFRVPPDIQSHVTDTEIDTEQPFDLDDHEGGHDTSHLSTADSSWPVQGRIEFIDVAARYRKELPLVLQHVSFVVEGQEKVGVVGRTGSGKSTLMQLLFRIMELDSGRIEIDGFDISRLGLKQLRQAISILPQDPTLCASLFPISLLFCAAMMSS